MHMYRIFDLYFDWNIKFVHLSTPVFEVNNTIMFEFHCHKIIIQELLPNDFLNIVV